ncbi:hypothetical protein GCM10010435_05060 [Winogradskya consettensis]|uniref:Hydrolase n=2 Tax=Winogradskya TaxID=3240235 RepID=A0A919SVV4_9ACTN|nr:hypothetical protein Ahu01nite_049290 [Actinoplanes humidus]GIM79591.1 hypothetical protein Aco04nite_66310 [Actinoplanes consettensis]
MHGGQNQRPIKHWQYLLAQELTRRGHPVRYPQLPESDAPVLKDWLTAIENELAGAAGSELVVIAHSLSCAAWLHLSRRGSVHLPVARLLFVAPPSPEYLAGEPIFAEFVPPPGAHHDVTATSVAQPRLVCTTDDPVCRPSADVVYPGVFSTDHIPGGGHLDLAAGYGRWPSMVEWCDNPGVRLVTNKK